VTSFAFKNYLFLCEWLGLMSLDLKALDGLNQQKGLVIAPNHPSMIDIVLITSRINNCACVVKNSLMKHLFLGVSARASAYIPNDDITQMVRASQSVIESSAHVVVFPEGTRTDSGTRRGVNAIGGSAALIAKRTHTSIQLVYIYNSCAFLGQGWPVFKRPQFPIVYRIELGPLIQANDDLKATVQQMQEAYEKALIPLM
jgi:1-acyl-sn-glycerol-3-phosphate acyltransferase